MSKKYALGVCYMCYKNIYENMVYEEETGKTYHVCCYNDLFEVVNNATI